MQKITHVTTLLAVLAVLSVPMAQGQSVATPTYTSDTHEYLLDKWPAQMGQFSDGYVLVRTHNDDVSQFMIFDDKGKKTGEFSCATEWVVSITQACPKFRNGVAPFYIKGEMGSNYMAWVDFHGTIVKKIPIQETGVDYEFTRDGFITTLCQLQAPDGSKHRVLCYFDTQGNEVFRGMRQVFDEVYERRKPMRDFCDELCCFYDYKTERYGYFNRAGQVVIPAQYKQAHDFSEGKAAVSPDGETWGYIDIHGEQCIKYLYTQGEPSDFHEGFAVVPMRAAGNRVYSFIDTEGNIKATYAEADRFFNGYAWVKPTNGDQPVIVNKDFQQVGKQSTTAGVITYHEAQGVIQDRRNLFKPDGTWCFDPKQIDLLEVFSDGFIGYKCSQSYGYVGMDGTVIIKFVLPTGN